MKKPWRLAEHITGADWIYVGGIFLSCSSCLQDFGIKNYIKEILATISRFDNYFYFHSDEYQKTRDDILQRVSENPEWGIKFNRNLKKLLDKQFYLTRKAEKKYLNSLSNKQLADLWRKLYQAKEEAHAAGVITTWIIDADNQFTKYLTAQIEKLIITRKLQEDPASLVSILTAPLQDSSIRREEIALFELLKKAKSRGIVNIYSDILRHAKQCGWIYYKYIGPSKTSKEYQNILEDWLKQGIDPDAKISEIRQQKRKLQEKQKYFLKLLNPDQKLKKLIQFAKQIPVLKDYRKTIQFYNSYVNEKILKEIAKRFSLSLNQVRQFLAWEVESVLLGKDFDPEILNQRYEFSVFHSRGANYKLLVGKKAQDFLKRQRFEKIKMDIKEICGACACVGKAKAVAKIINIPDEIGKIKQGEIMVSHATYPNLVPAMRKAAAIITDEGGLTSHAAIVSRELSIPCVVGTKIATQVLKDGDLVEVDANKGTVRKI